MKSLSKTERTVKLVEEPAHIVDDLAGDPKEVDTIHTALVIAHIISVVIQTSNRREE